LPVVAHYISPMCCYRSPLSKEDISANGVPQELFRVCQHDTNSRYSGYFLQTGRHERRVRTFQKQAATIVCGETAPFCGGAQMRPAGAGADHIRLPVAWAVAAGDPLQTILRVEKREMSC
jgi:hypothetical protein